MGAQVMTESATFFFSIYFCVRALKMNDIGPMLDMVYSMWSRVTSARYACDSCLGRLFHLFALLPQAKRRLALDDSDHQHQSEPIRTPRGKAATANGTRIKAPRSEQLRRARLHVYPSSASSARSRID